MQSDSKGGGGWGEEWRTEVSIKAAAGQSVASRQSVGRRQAARWWVLTSRQSEKSFEETQWRKVDQAVGQRQAAKSGVVTAF